MIEETDIHKKSKKRVL